MPTIQDSKCILITGGTGGIGRALALSLLSLPSKPTVIVTGRRQERLDEIIQANGSGGKLKALKMDVDTDRSQLKSAVDHIVKEFPQLDTIIFNAGIQHRFDFTKPETIELDKLTSEFNTNYLSIITMITFFMPHLLAIAKQGQPCFIYNITSILGIVPGAWVPNYAATKAALHSLTLSLHSQLKDTGVYVGEVFPPLVESELHDHQGTRDFLSKSWMPLDDFTQITMERLKRGDLQAPIGAECEGEYERFEGGKLDSVLKMFVVYQR